MHRRKLIRVVGALGVVALLGLSPQVAPGSVKKGGCACCGPACACSACACESKAKAGASCCKADRSAGVSSKASCACCGDSCACQGCACEGCATHAGLKVAAK